ncbi:hypothetical protein ACFLU5_17440, partial [Bacteroidota bacterium]
MKSQKISLFALLILIISGSCSPGRPPTDTNGRPLIIKSGTIDVDLVETTPVVFQNRIYRFEYVRAGYWDNKTDDSYFRFVDHETGISSKPFAKGFHLGSAFVHNGTIYVTAVDIWDGEQIHVFSSKNMDLFSIPNINSGHI